MCGILLYFGDAQLLSKDYSALSIVNHRGPDAFNLVNFKFSDKFITLGHQRLAIIDLDQSANQPMRFLNSGKWIVFNGEIYNYIELRRELKSYGYVFETKSDTEVLLAAYDKWGENCLNKLNGMFVFCIWDGNTGEIFFARDRYGVKPCYYWKNKDSFVIVSEIKQLQAIPGFQSKANANAVLEFIKSGDFSYDQYTLWDEVYELEPGCCCRINLHKWSFSDIINPNFWYKIDSKIFKFSLKSSEEILEEFKFILSDAVKIRLRSDVQVGTLLSGGVDSSTITCLASQSFNKVNPLQAYSACYQEKRYDEQNYIDCLANFPAVNINKVYFSPHHLQETIDTAIYHSDLPTQGRAVFARFQLYKRIKERNIKVVLEGQGADEILAGYNDFSWAYLNELFSRGKLINFSKEFYLYMKYSNPTFPFREFAKRKYPLMFNRFFKKPMLVDKIIKKDFSPAKALLDRLNSANITEVHFSRLKILRQILHNVDRFSMAFGIETRTPFLDYRLVEFSLSLPSELKIKNGFRKHLLREAVREIVPEKIRLRSDKMGFSSPEPEWAKGALKEYYYDAFNDLENVPYFDHKKVLQSFDEYVAGKSPYNWVFSRLSAFSRWRKIFRVSC